jgi:hypothetical protein
MPAAGVQLGTPSERFSIALRSTSASPVSDLIGRDALMNGRFAKTGPSFKVSFWTYLGHLRLMSPLEGTTFTSESRAG